MHTGSSGSAAHRTWIAQARRESDEAERVASDARRRAATLFEPGYFPGYDLEAEIHRGAQGVVYRARQLSTGRAVALKLMHDGVFGGALDRARFEREMRVLAALKHPNIVAIHDGGSRNERFFLVMEYVDGQPLDGYMAARPRSIRETLNLFIPICDAVNAAHLRGIIHRDLKPGNVRVDESGRPVVLDFGLAKIAPGSGGASLDSGPAMTMTGQFVGSLPWSAPEQAGADPALIDTRTDVYALGVLLYQMLTGALPYTLTGNMKQALDSILERPPRSPRALRSDVDGEIETIVLKCLSKERERRYQTAGELAADLRRYLAGEPVEARRDSSMYVARKYLQRYRGRFIAAGLLLGLLLASSVISSALWFQAERASGQARGNLGEALVQQARATRRSGWIGQRHDAIAALTRAAEIERSLEVRNEIIAALAAPDIRFEPEETPAAWVHDAVEFDRDMALRAFELRGGELLVERVADGAMRARIPPPPDTADVDYITIRLTPEWVGRLFEDRAGERRLEIWSITEARCVLNLREVPSRSSFDFSPDGRSVAVLGRDRAVRVYDIESSIVTRRLPLDRDQAYVTYDPSGDSLAVYHSEEPAGVLDVASGAFEPAFDVHKIQFDVAWSADGRFLAGASGPRIIVWDRLKRKIAAMLDGHDHAVTRLTFGRRGAWLGSYSWEGTSAIWDAQTYRQILRFPGKLTVFSHDGNVAGGAFRDERQRPSTRGLLAPAQAFRMFAAGDAAEFYSGGRATFDPVSDAVAMAAHQDGIDFFDAATGELLGGLTAPAIWLEFEAGGDSFVAAEARGLYRWPRRADPGTLKFGPPQLLVPARCAAWTPAREDRPAFAVAVHEDRNGFTLFDLSRPDEPRSFATNCVDSATFSPDGRLLAFAGWRNEGVELWDVDSGARVARLPLPGKLRAAFASDSRTLYISDTHEVTAWEGPDWRMMRRAAVPGCMLRVSPDGSLLATCENTATRVHLLDARTLQEVALLEPPAFLGAVDLAFNAEGTKLAVSTTRGRTIQLWDLAYVRGELAKLDLDWTTP